jgi:hypothetical protein
VRIWKFGFDEQVFNGVEIVAGGTTTINVDLVPTPTATVSGYVLNNSLTPVANAELTVGDYPVDSVLSNPDGFYSFTLPVGLTYDLRAAKTGEGSARKTFTLSGPIGYTLILPSVLFNYEFESDEGWISGSAGDNATSGLWERADPTGTWSMGDKMVQPEDDHTNNPAYLCWITDGTAGVPVEIGDVEGGRTTLLSPIWDLSGAISAQVEIWTWYSNDEGANPGEDHFRIDISNDGGAGWISMLDTTGDWETWQRSEFFLNDYLTLTDSTRIRVIASDEGAGSSHVEAAVDDACLYVQSGQLPAPADLAIHFDGATVTLYWDPVPYASHYEVWKYNVIPFVPDSGTVVGEPADTSFADTDISSGEAGFYFVRACP